MMAEPRRRTPHLWQQLTDQRDQGMLGGIQSIMQ